MFKSKNKKIIDDLDRQIEQLTEAAQMQYPFSQFIQAENIPAAILELCRAYEKLPSSRAKLSFTLNVFYPCLRILGHSAPSAALFKNTCYFALTNYYNGAGKPPPQELVDSIDVTAEELQRLSLFAAQ